MSNLMVSIDFSRCDIHPSIVHGMQYRIEVKHFFYRLCTFVELVLWLCYGEDLRIVRFNDVVNNMPSRCWCQLQNVIHDVRYKLLLSSLIQCKIKKSQQLRWDYIWIIGNTILFFRMKFCFCSEIGRTTPLTPWL